MLYITAGTNVPTYFPVVYYIRTSLRDRKPLTTENRLPCTKSSFEKVDTAGKIQTEQPKVTSR